MKLKSGDTRFETRPKNVKPKKQPRPRKAIKTQQHLHDTGLRRVSGPQKRTKRNQDRLQRKHTKSKDR